MEMTIKNIVILFILCNLLNSGTCCPGLPTPIGAITPDHDVEVGGTISLNCSLHNHTVRSSRTKLAYANSSMLALKFKQMYITENVYIIDPLTIQLRIENATIADRGKYYCFLNVADKRRLVCAAEVTVGYPPLPVKSFSCVSWHYQNLTCSWTPEPNPVRTKYTLKDYIIYNKNISTGILRPCPVNLSDTSCQWRLDTATPYRKNVEKIYFNLTGTNSLGTYSELIEFNNFERVLPSAPYELRAHSVTKNSIEVIWLPPREMSIEGDFRPGLTYQLLYKSNYSNTWNSITVNGTKRTEILDLNPYTPYELKLRCRSRVAYTEDMWSNFTELYVKTDADIPYTAPEVIEGLFQIRNFGELRNITIFWKPVPKIYWNGDDFNYLVSYSEIYKPILRGKREMTSSNWLKVDNKPVPSATFTNMNIDTDYVFRIKTYNSIGTSDKYSKIEVNKRKNMVPSPKDIVVTDYGQGMYHISWSMSNEFTLPIRDFIIYWCEVKSRSFPCKGPFQWAVVSKEHKSVKLNLSDVDTNYQFAISANTESSSSGLEWAPCIVPHNRVMNKIRNVIPLPINATSLKVTWHLDCVAQKNVITAYRLIYCESEENACKRDTNQIVTIDDSHVDSYVLTRLKPFTKYRIAIAALTSGGFSEPSNYVVERTKSGAPSDPPQHVSLKSKTDTTMELSVSPPNIRNGEITKYDIQIIAADGNSRQQEERFRERNLTIFIDKLTPYTNYTIEIKACVNHDCSPPSILYERTDIGVPGVMDPPIPEVHNSTFVQVSWQQPSSPNGPINFYTLHVQWEGDNEIQNQSINVSVPKYKTSSSDHIYYNMNIDCPFVDKDVQYSFSVQAANIKNGNILYGNQSSQTQTKLCYSNEGMTWYMILGMIVGSTIGLVILIILIYGFARWMKKKVDTIKDIKVQLPPGLESPNSLNSYENFKNGLIRKASESNLSPQTLYGRLSSYASDEGDPKEPPDSDASQFSNNSTEELLYKKNGQKNHGGGHASEDNNTGKGHDSISSSLTNRTQLSSDSGAETDVLPPPSPESDNGQGLPHSSPQPQNKSILPKVDEANTSESKDSGLEKEGGGNEKESGSNHYSRFVCYLDNPQHPYNQRKMADRSNGIQQLPYSKFGVNMPGVSGYIPLANSLVFMSRSLANSEPSVVDVEKIKETDQEIATDTVASPYSKYGLARSFGEALNMPVADMYEVNNGYSKCGVASNMPYLQNAKKSYVPTKLSTAANVPIPSSNDVQLTEQSKENVKELPLPTSWTPTKSNGYVTVDKLLNPNKASPTQPIDGIAYSRLGTKPEIGKTGCQSKGYVSVQDAKDMLSGKEKVNQVELKEPPVGIPGYSKFDIQCDRLENTPKTETMDPVLTGAKPKIYPNNVRQDYVPYCGFNDTSNDFMCNKSPDLEVKGQNSNNNSVIFPMDDDSGNITPNLSPTKYLAQPKVHEPKNGYVQINPEMSPDSIKIVPSDAYIHSSLTDTAV